MSKHFLPVRRTEPQMLQPSQDLTESTSQQKSSEVDPEEDPETLSTDPAEQKSTSPLGQWRESRNTLFVPEGSHNPSSTIMEQKEAKKPSNFQHRVRHILRVGRIQNMGRDPTMYGRILGSSTNKFIRFCADSGTPAAFIPRNVAVELCVD